MPNVFKKSITRYLDSDGRQVPKGTPGARKVKEKSAKWYGRVPDSLKPVPLATNKVAAQQQLAMMVKKAELGRAGIHDPFEEESKRLLSEHLEDFRRDLAARDNAPRYVQLVVSRLTALLEGCGFLYVTDLSASRAVDWLAELHRKGRFRIVLPAGQESFTPREAGAVLGIKSLSVGTAVRRLGLEATGKGKARRFPRATVEALQDRLARSASVQTTNDYLSALRSFGRWMVKDRRLAENPFEHLEGGNAKVDRRHDRRELEVEELRALLAAARNSERSLRGLTDLTVTTCTTPPVGRGSGRPDWPA
jgi:hypothetical protein